jgi:hypothetical protein
MKLGIFIQYFMVALPAATAFDFATLYILAESNIKNKTVVTVTNGTVEQQDVFSDEEEAGWTWGGCIGEDNGVDWVESDIGCPGKTFYNQVGQLNKWLGETRLVNITTPDYTLLVSLDSP